MNPTNIQTAFRRCGIYPFDVSVIPDELLAPSLTFPVDHCTPTVVKNVASKETVDHDPHTFLEKYYKMSRLQK
jgi:hypothetical protein